MRTPIGNRGGRGRLSILLTVITLLWSGGAMAATLDQIRDSQSIRIAYREDAAPFSYKGGDGQPAGFMVELCRLVAQRIAKQLNVADLKPVYVPVTAAERFEAVRQGRADLLCEATTATLSRRELVDFSLPTFIDGASLMIRAGGPNGLDAMAGRRIGVLGDTTTEIALRNELRRAAVEAEVVPMLSHHEGVAQLDDDKIAAYFADRAILSYLVRDSRAPWQLRIAEQYLTVEPYALALPRGDSAFRLAVDRALSHIYRSGEIIALFRDVFGAEVNPSQILKSVYIIAGLPD